MNKPDISEKEPSVESLGNETEQLRRLLELYEREHQLIVYELHDGVVQYAGDALPVIRSDADA